ncbi:MAG: beta-lactamase family protein [Planctomycetes bacterium]|nr:beta-lactamase family protein [Planctomycetota bacterium]
MTAAHSPSASRGDRWLPRVIDRVARVHPRLGMLRFEEALRRNTLSLMQKHRVPGVQISFSIGDCAVRTLCFGVMCAQRRIPITPLTVFGLCSVTKPLTALGVLALVKDQVLHLDEPLHDEIVDLFTGISQEDSSRLRGITLRHCLAHTSGLAHFNPPRSHDPCRQTWLNASNLKFVRDPGAASGYSGINYALVEIVMEWRTGLPFSKIMGDSVLRPLKMEHSRFERDIPVADEQLSSDHDEHGHVFPTPPTVCHASSGLVSSTEQVCRGLQACHFSDGFLPRDLSQLQLTPQPSGLLGATATLGLHLHKGLDARSLSHGGTRPGHRSLVVVVPEARAVLCIAANSESGAEVFKPITGFFRAITIGA